MTPFDVVLLRCQKPGGGAWPDKWAAIGSWRRDIRDKTDGLLLQQLLVWRASFLRTRFRARVPDVLLTGPVHQYATLLWPRV
jgi:hypothetical protein